MLHKYVGGNCFFSSNFIFAKGMQLKINILCVFFCGKTTPRAKN